MKHGVSERAFSRLPFAHSEDREALDTIASTTGNHGPPRSRGAQTKPTPSPPCGSGTPSGGGTSAPQHHRPLSRSRAAESGPRTPFAWDSELTGPLARAPTSSLPSLSPEARAHGPPLPTPPKTHPWPRAPARRTAGERARARAGADQALTR